MNNIKTTGYSLMLIACIIAFMQCKSVEFTFLGLYKKKYSKEIEKSNIVIASKRDFNSHVDTLTTISGVVTDTTNNPINGADICINKGNQIVSFASSDKNGKYSITNLFQINNDLPTDTITKMAIVADSISKHKFDGIQLNSYKVVISANGFKNEERIISINQFDNIKLNFLLKKMCSVSGVVTMYDKCPVKDAIILLRRNDNELIFVKTNDNGEFFKEGLESGTYTIIASHNKYIFSIQIVELYNGVDYKGVQLISSKGEISGFIKTVKSNIAVQKAIITVQKIDFKDYILGQPFQMVDTSEINGSYKIEGLNSGKYKIQVNAIGYGSLIKDVELSENQIQKRYDFTLSEEGVISGQLTNYNPNDEIVFMVIDSNKNVYKANDIEIKDNGKYLIKGISTGIYTIILKKGSILLYGNSINVIAGKETSRIDIALKEATGCISGRITSESNNKPIENAMIIASSRNSGNHAFSDSNGNYEIFQLSQGTYEMFVNALSFESACKSELQIINNDSLKNVDFNLQQKKNK